MSFDWLMPFAASAALSGLSALAAWRISAVRSEVKTEGDFTRSDELRVADRKRADELRSADEKRAEELRVELRDLKRAWDDGIERVGELASNMASVQSAQNQINVFTSKAVEGLVGDVERLKDTVADHTSSIRLLIDKVMTK